jgi:hypothetical protein
LQWLETKIVETEWSWTSDVNVSSWESLELSTENSEIEMWDDDTLHPQDECEEMKWSMTWTNNWNW